MADDWRLRDAEIWRAQAALGQEGPEEWAQGFFASALAGVGGLVGIEKSPYVQAWEQKHPIGGFTASLLGPTGYYVGAAKAGRSLLAGTKLMGQVDRLAEGAGAGQFVVRRALGDVVAVAPAEAGRLALTAGLGNDIGEVGADIALGTAITGTLGAGIGLLESAGKRTVQRWKGRSAENAAWPEQLQLRELLPKLEKGHIADVDNAKRLIAEWRTTIRRERASREGMPGVQVLDRKEIAERIPLGRRVQQSYIRDELEGPGDARELNRAFFVRSGIQRSDAKTISRPLAVAGPGRGGYLGFESAEELADVELRAGLMPDWEAYGQFPTYRAYRDPKLAAKFEEKVVGPNMTQVGDGWWLARERGRAGMYVLGKKLPGDEAARGSEWFFVKTDVPGFFAPKAGSLARTADASNAFWRRADELAEAGIKSEVFQATKMLEEQLPVTLFDDAERGLMAKGGEKAAGVVAKLLDVGETGAARDAIGSFFRSTLAPTTWQFAKHPAANRAWQIARAAFDSANALGTKLVYGESKLVEGQNGLLQLLKAPRGGDSVHTLVEALDSKDLENLSRVLFRGGGVEGAKGAGAGERVVRLLQRLQEIDADRIGKLQSLQQATGESRVRARPEHFMLSRSWRGTHRAPVYEGDVVVALGSGFSRGQAQAEARFIAQRGRELGRNWGYRDEVFQHDTRADLGFLSRMTHSRNALQLAGQLREEFALKSVRRPGHFQQRRGMGGAIGEFKPFTKQEILDTLNRHIHQNLRYEAELSTRHLLFNELSRLKFEDPSIHAQLMQRIDDLVGKQGPAATWINQQADKLLGDFVGKDSATRIVRGVNSFMYQTSFGFFNLAHSALQLGTFLQTGLPELAFIRGGHTPELARAGYQLFMRGGPDGLPRELVSALSPVKAAGAGLRLLMKPDAEFIEALSKARNDGLLNPRILEEFAGPDATFRTSLGEALRSGGLVKMLLKAGSWPVEKADELARAHAFATGWNGARRILMRDPGEAFQFARDFTHRTMYGYSVADRPRAFTGPFGSALGLFKNWQMHYMMQLLDYASLGASKGDWRPLLWGFGGSVALGGLPAAGGLYWVADRFAKDIFGKKVDELWYEQWPRGEEGPNVSDAVFMGVPGFLPTLVGLPGFSLTSATQMPGGNPARDVSQLMSFVYYDRMKYLGRAVGEAFDAADATGQNPLRSEQVTANLGRALLPRALYRVMQQTEDGAIRASGSLYPQVDGLSPSEQALYSLGFNPHKLELAYRVNDRLWQSAEERKALVSAMGQQLAAAQQARDYREMGRLKTRAMYLGVDMDSVMRSMSAYGQKYREDMIERQGDKEAVRWYQRLGLVGQ